MAGCKTWAGGPQEPYGIIQTGISTVNQMSTTAMATLSTSLNSLQAAASSAIGAISMDIAVDGVEQIPLGSFTPPTFSATYTGQEVTTPGILDAPLENAYIPTHYPANPAAGLAPAAITVTVGDVPANTVGAYPENVPGPIDLAPPVAPILVEPAAVVFGTLTYPGFTGVLLEPERPTPPVLDFGVLPDPPVLNLPTIPGPAPTLVLPNPVTITDPDVSAIMAKFDELVAGHPADPDFSYTTPEYQWLLDRLDAAEMPAAPGVHFTPPDFSTATALLTAALAALPAAPEGGTLTPIDIDVTFTDPAPDTTALEDAATAMRELADAFLPNTLATNDALLAQTETTFAANGLAPIISALKDRVGEFLSATEDRIGLPVVVETALRDRAFAGVDKLSFQQERQAIENWLARGFTLPGGVLAAQTFAIKQLGFDKKNEMSRDIFIESAKLKLEALWNAIKTGIDYEFKYREYYQRNIELAVKITDAQLSAYKDVIGAYSQSITVLLAVWQGKLQVKELIAKLVIARADAEIKQLQAEIAVYEAAIKLIEAKLSAIEGLIKIGLAEVDVQKAENAALVDMYKAQIAAYGAEVDAVKALMGIPALEADLEKTRLGAEADAYKAKSDGWKTQLNVFPEIVKAELYKVDAGKARVDNERLKNEFSALLVQNFQSEIEGAKTQVSGEETRVRGYTAQTTGFDARIRGEATKVTQYSAEIDLEKTKSLYNEVLLKKSELELEKDKLIIAKDQTAVQQHQSKVTYEKIRAEFFATEVQAFQAQINAALAEFEGYKAEIQGYAAQMQGYESEVRGFAAQMQGEDARVRLYGSEVQAFAEHIRAYGAELDGWKTTEMGAIETEKSRQSATVAMMQGAIAAMDKIIERNKTELMAYDAAIRQFAADVDGKKTVYSVESGNLQANISNMFKELQIKVSTATTKMEKAVEASRILIGAFSSESSAAAQVVAGAMSALHMSGQLSSSFGASDQISCGTSYNYDM